MPDNCFSFVSTEIYFFFCSGFYFFNLFSGNRQWIILTLTDCDDNIMTLFSTHLSYIYTKIVTAFAVLRNILYFIHSHIKETRTYFTIDQIQSQFSYMHQLKVWDIPKYAFKIAWDWLCTHMHICKVFQFFLLNIYFIFTFVILARSSRFFISIFSSFCGENKSILTKTRRTLCADFHNKKSCTNWKVAMCTTRAIARLTNHNFCFFERRRQENNESKDNNK